uniref:ATP synthase F0 subunit 8 n=1 Tax=Gari togata TaxID=2774046 RepID=A0A8K1DUJ3_9BIVA|nr:ATP synthase F0 subunit 8 [Gari togata]
MPQMAPLFWVFIWLGVLVGVFGVVIGLWWGARSLSYGFKYKCPGVSKG